MEENKMNILVLGNSGAGKSTLINAISGVEVKTGVGEGNTQSVEMFESDTWPIRLIDTKGFEYNLWEQMKTIKQIKKFTKEKVGKGAEEKFGIDAVWYCIEGTTRRMFVDNINMMNKSIKGWKNIPIFAVLTKSYSETDIEENKRAIYESFAKNDKSNLKDVIPVVAKAYVINEETVVQPRGIDELCLATLECSEEAKHISEDNRTRMVLQQKRCNANAVVVGATTAGVVVGAVPNIPFGDSLILVPLETGLTKCILKIYGVEFSGDMVSAIVGSAAITNVALAAVNTLKTIPNIAGSVVNAVVAGFFVATLGEAVIGVSEAICRGVVDADKIESVVNFVAKKIKESVIMRFVVEYFEEHADKLKDKSAKEIYSEIGQALKNKTKLKK